MTLHFQLTADPRWHSLRERFADVESGLEITLADCDGATGPRLLLHRSPDPQSPDEVGFLLEDGESGIVEISPGAATSRELMAAAWAIAVESGLVPVRLAPGAASLVARLREIEDPDRDEEDEAACLAIFLGSVLEDGTTGAKELDLIVRHARPDRTHPFEVLNSLPETRRRALLEQARIEAGRPNLPWPLRRDLRSGTVLAERRVDLRFEDEVARIRLVRPQLLNALDSGMLTELADAWQDAEARIGVEAIVLEAEGPAFMAGVDLGRILEWIESDRLDRIEDFVGQAHRFLANVDASPKHTLVFLDGLAVGAGAEFCTAFDTVLATSRASIGFPELSLAIYPAMGGTQRLPRRIGYLRARQWILSAALLTASKAKAAGLVDAIIDGQDLPSRAREDPTRERAATKPTANDGPSTGVPDDTRWRKKAPVALAVAEELLELSRRAPLAEGLAAEIENLSRVFGTPEALASIRRAQGRARRSRPD